MPYRFIYLLFPVLAMSSCEQARESADLILLNARIWTADPALPEAGAMAVRGEDIVAIGSEAEIMRWKGPETELLDAGGRFVSPGFIDCHVHFLTGGFNLASVQLRDAGTPREFASRIGAYAQTVPAGTWILGGDWDHELWGGALPDRNWIDSLTPDHPVFVQRLDGHMALANSKALELAGVDKDTKEVTGGEIVRRAGNEPTGVLKDNAMGLVYGVAPAPSLADHEKALQAAMNYVAAQGVTSVHDMGETTPPGYMEALEKARRENRLITRIYAMMPLSQWPALKARIAQQGKGDHWLKIGGLKGFADGSLGSHTAAFLEPYTDNPAYKGIYVSPRDSLYRWISGADQAGLQVMLHAIGDEAIRTVLDIFQRVQEENGEKDRRFRIEHAQHIAPADIARFAELKVIPSMQPYHAIDDGRWAERVIGPERIKTTYAFRSLLDAQAGLAFGSDWFVAPPTPLEGIYAAVTRRTLDDKNPDGWVPEQKITVEQALMAYTRNAAYASFEENRKGSLTPGKLADFVILSEDLRTIAPEKIREVKVWKTVVGGKVVF